VIHYDLWKATTRQIQSFCRVSLEEWFPLDRQPGVDYFYMTIQEDFHRAYVNANVPVTAHGRIPLQSIVDLIGEDVRTYLSTVPRLVDLVGRTRLYVLSWVREFFATVWIHLDHSMIVRFLVLELESF
jgi:hypothetical protein